MDLADGITALEADLIAAINDGGAVRLVLVPEEPAVAATYAGIGNFDGAPPTLVATFGDTPPPTNLDLSIEAIDVATVRPDGPRGGSFGKIFFNVQGSANGGFASFGVIDYEFDGMDQAEGSLFALSLELIESNASFTTDGDYSIYLTDATDVDIQAGSSPLQYQGSNDGLASVDPLLTNLTLLGSTRFVENGDGEADSVVLTTTMVVEETFRTAINAGGTVRLVLVPDEASVAATWAGIGNFDGPAPTLNLSFGEPPAPKVFINEFHYDNDQSDVGEFVELAGTSGASLEGFTLVLYNGNGGAPYGTLNLSGTLAPDGVTPGLGFFSIDTPGLQNGSPDGIALIDPDGNVVEFLSYEGFFIAEDGPAAGVVSVDIGATESGQTQVGFSLQRTGELLADPASGCALDENTEITSVWAAGEETPDGTNIGQTCGAPVVIDPIDAAIYEIQGASHTSPLLDMLVRTSGIVTQVGQFDSVGSTSPIDGFFLQDPDGDGDDATSDGIFVFVSNSGVSVGDSVEVIATVAEATARSRELSTTRLEGVRGVTMLGDENALPEPVKIGSDRIPPSEVIEDDGFTTFEPESDGADFFESIEGMLVEVEQPLAVSGTNRFGEIFVVAGDGLSATGLSARGTLNISVDDFNPEKIQIDPGLGAVDFFDTGARFESIVGTVAYDFGNFQVQPSEPLVLIDASTVAPETTSLLPGAGALTVASYNVLNLETEPSDGDDDLGAGRFDAVAAQIVSNLGTPDIVGLQEIQDNSGALNDGTVAADITLQTLVDAITEAGGPTYEFIDNTFIGNNTSGGQPGGNIRTAFLYNPDRVDLVAGLRSHGRRCLGVRRQPVADHRDLRVQR